MTEKSTIISICKLGLAYQTLNKTIERSFGLSLVQWYLIDKLKDLPGISAKELAKTLGVHPSTLTQSLKRLDKKELIAINDDPRDSRKKKIALTITGYNAHKKFEQSLKEPHKDIIKHFESIKLCTQNIS